MAFGSSERLKMDCCLDLFETMLKKCPGHKSPSVNYGALVGERNSDWRMGYNNKAKCVAMAQFHGSLCRFRKELKVIRYLLSILWCIDFATDVEFVEWHKSFKSLKIDFW